MWSARSEVSTSSSHRGAHRRLVEGASSITLFTNYLEQRLFRDHEVMSEAVAVFWKPSDDD